jgi:hypothetical protein
MIAGSLITIREGLEAFDRRHPAGVFDQINQPKFKAHLIEQGSILVSILLAATSGVAIQFEGDAAEILEAAVALLAVVCSPGWCCGCSGRRGIGRNWSRK